MMLRPHGRLRWTWLDVVIISAYSIWAFVNVYLIPRLFGVSIVDLLWRSATLTASANPVFPFVWVLTLSLFAIGCISFRSLGWIRTILLAGSLYFLLEELSETPAFLLAYALYPNVDGWWGSSLMLTIYASWTLLGLSSAPLWKVSRWSVIAGASMAGSWAAWLVIGFPTNVADVVGSQTVQPVNFVFEVGLKVLTMLFLASLVIAGQPSREVVAPSSVQIGDPMTDSAVFDATPANPRDDLDSTSKRGQSEPQT